MKYEVTRGIRWRPSPKSEYRRAGAGDVLDDVKLKGADVDWLIANGALVKKKGATDGSR